MTFELKGLSFTLVILYEGYRTYLFIELPLGEGFEEIASRIFKYAGLDSHYAVYGGFDYIHMLGSSHRGGLF